MYAAILIAPDGDWVIDYHNNTVQEVEEALANQGSRWYFYPFHGVIRIYGREGIYHWSHLIVKKKLASVAPPFEEYKGKSVKTFLKHLESLSESEMEAIING